MATENKNNDFDNSNIFDDMSINPEAEVNFSEIQKEVEKDKYYYIGIGLKLLKGLNFLMLFIIIIGGTYLYIQKSDGFLEKPYLDFICPVLLGESKSYIGVNCSGLTSFETNFTEKLNSLQNDTFNKVMVLLPDVYNIDSLTKSKDIIFLLDKSQNRLKVSKILDSFDKLKNGYDFDKKRITCGSIYIDSKLNFKTTCSAYASDWEDNGIVGYNGSKDEDLKISGTSNALAESFLNYIEKNSEEFTLINKQKTFTSDSVTTDGIYTSKTTFSLDLKYNGDNLVF